MSNPPLDSFVSQSRQAGQSDEQIRQALTNAGWGAEDVNQALGGGRGIPSPASPIALNVSSASGPVPFGVKFLAVLGFIGSVMAVGFGLFFLDHSLGY